jgi:hypothetical protein
MLHDTPVNNTMMLLCEIFDELFHSGRVLNTDRKKIIAGKTEGDGQSQSQMDSTGNHDGEKMGVNCASNAT